jgi:hypothetical protein
MATPKFLDVIYGGSETDLLSFYNQSETIFTQARPLGDLLYADPLLWFICSFHRRAKVDRFMIRVVDKPPLELSMSNRNPYFLGFAVISNLLRKRARQLFRRSSPSWNRRRSSSVFGTWTGVNPSPRYIKDYLSTLTLPGGIGDVEVDFSRYQTPGGPVDHISFYGLQRFARRLEPYVGSTFRRTSSLGRYGSHVLSGLVISDSAVSYNLKNVVWQSYPSGKYMTCSSIGISISRSEMASSSITISITGLTNVRVDGVAGTYPKYRSVAIAPNLVTAGYSKQAYDHYLALAGEISSTPMRLFAPALYHTGCKALSDCLIDYSKNFENFVESAELVKLFYDITNFAGTGARSFMPTMGSRGKRNKAIPVENVIYKKNSLWAWVSDPSLRGFQRVKRLANLFSGSKLAVDFAISPSLRSAWDLAKKTILPLTGESEIKHTLATLPPGLEAIVIPPQRLTKLGVTKADIIRLEIRFRSEVIMCPDYQALAQAFLDANPGLSLGILPSPESVWKVGKYTFIVDWFLDVSRLIKDATTYVMSPFLPYRVGHTVRLQMDLRDGRSFDAFWRSLESDHLINPPADSWLPSVGLQSSSIPLVVQKLTSGR